MGYRTAAFALFAFSTAAAFGQSAPAPATLPPAQPATGSAPTPVRTGDSASPAAPSPPASVADHPLAPVASPASGVTQRVRNAAAHDVDAQGHTLDPHGKPVGQAPLPTPATH